MCGREYGRWREALWGYPSIIIIYRCCVDGLLEPNTVAGKDARQDKNPKIPKENFLIGSCIIVYDLL